MARENPSPRRSPELKRPEVRPALIEDAGALALEEALRTSFKFIKFIMVVLVVAFVFSGMFIVKPNEVAIRLHFGRPVGTGSEQLLKPGLHWAFPYPIDEIVRIPVGQSHTLVSRTGWYAVTPEEEASGQLPPPMPYLQAGVDGYTLAGDGNVIHAKATLKYRLQTNGVAGYVFNFTQTSNVLQGLLDNALVYASARFSADAALYRELTAFRDEVTRRFQQHLDDLQIGVFVDSLDVQTTAPLAVKPDFDAVVNVQQQAGTNVSQARIYASLTTNAALAQSSTLINQGLSRSNELVKTVASDASSFQKLLPLYRANPELFRQRLLTETMQRVLTNAQEKFFVPARTDGKTRELRLQLSREPAKPAEHPEN